MDDLGPRIIAKPLEYLKREFHEMFQTLTKTITLETSDSIQSLPKIKEVKIQLKQDWIKFDSAFRKLESSFKSEGIVEERGMFRANFEDLRQGCKFYAMKLNSIELEYGVDEASTVSGFTILTAATVLTENKRR